MPFPLHYLSGSAQTFDNLLDTGIVPTFVLEFLDATKVPLVSGGWGCEELGTSKDLILSAPPESPVQSQPFPAVILACHHMAGAHSTSTSVPFQLPGHSGLRVLSKEGLPEGSKILSPHLDKIKD